DNSARTAIQEIDRDVYVPPLEPLKSLIGVTLTQPRFNMMLLGAFAGVAMMLAAIGIYGVIAYTVAQRTREFGIRMALGAQRRDMLQMILRQSLSVVAIGLVIGLFAALALTRLMASLLYGVSAHDFSIYALVLFVLSAAARFAIPRTGTCGSHVFQRQGAKASRTRGFRAAFSTLSGEPGDF